MRPERPWLVPKSQRLSPAGRPRSGPSGVAVRALPKLTIRAEGDAIALYRAVLGVTGRPGYDVFARAVDSFVTTLPRASQEAIARELRRR